MRLTFKQTLLAVSLAGAFGVAQAQDTVALKPAGDLNYDLGADPTSDFAYTVTHQPSSFNDVFTFSLTNISDTITSAVTLEQPSFGGGFDYSIANGTFALYSDADGDGLDGTLITSTTLGTTNATFTATNLAAGSYYLAFSGDAVGSKGGIYNFTTNTAPIPEPETYALMLAGLGLLGFVGKRRMRRSSAVNFA